MMNIYASTYPQFFLKILFILHLERGEGEREGEKHQCVGVSLTPPTGDLARNPGVCPDWESNRGPFGSRAGGAQSAELHQPGPHSLNIFNSQATDILKTAHFSFPELQICVLLPYTQNPLDMSLPIIIYTVSTPLLRSLN